MNRPIPIAIALGSNLGDRASHLEFAARRLDEIFARVALAPIVETPPVGVPDAQGWFLNTAATAVTQLSARETLGHLLAIERERGRERPYAGAARTLDLDLILFGEQVVDEPGLHVPHPRFRTRRFVLEPLARIADGWRDPISGKTIGQLLASLPPAPPARRP